jgi:hypothetical protein
MLALAGCAEFDRQVDQGLEEARHPGALGRLIDTPPPAVTVVAGGPSGVLLSGAYVPDVPDMAVDSVVGYGLTEWLTFEERRDLAMASERAAIGVTGTELPWHSHDGGDTVTATGGAVAVGDAFRSLRGEICRDVRQSFTKNGEPHAQTVTLCREPIESGATLWVTAVAK